MFIKKVIYKYRILWVVLGFLILSLIFVIRNWIKIKNNDSLASSWTFNQNIFDSWTIIPSITWDNISWSNLTGIILTWTSTTEKTDLDNYYKLLDDWKSITFTFPNQPIDWWVMSYEERSNILNEYLKNNNKYFTIDSKINTGYVMIKTRRSTDDLFLYWHNSNLNWYKISWKLATTKSLQTESKNEYLFKLDQIYINRFYDKKLYNYNWKKDISSWELMFIGWYVVWFDWNKIETITIVYE